MLIILYINLENTKLQSYTKFHTYFQLTRREKKSNLQKGIIKMLSTLKKVCYLLNLQGEFV